MAAARAQADMADCVLAIGTSATVRPASGLMWIAKSNGAKVIEINPFETKLTPISDVVVRGAAGETLPALLERLSASRQSERMGVPESARQ
jgi:NAD-dependent deacetylase